MAKTKEKPIVRFFVPDGEGVYKDMSTLPPEEREKLSDHLGDKLAEALQRAMSAKMMN